MNHSISHATFEALSHSDSQSSEVSRFSPSLPLSSSAQPSLSQQVSRDYVCSSHNPVKRQKLSTYSSNHLASHSPFPSSHPENTLSPAMSYASPIPEALSPGDMSTGPSTNLNTGPLNSGPSTTLTTPDRSRRESAVFSSFREFFRKDSVLNKGASSTIPNPEAPTIDTLACPHGQNILGFAQADLGELVYEGRARIPGEREHFAKKKMTGESSTWYKDTEDWKTFQTPLSPRLPNAVTNLEADTEPNRWNKLRDHSPEPGDRRRRHSSIREALVNIFSTHGRRPSKKKQGKQPAKTDDADGSPSPSPNSEPVLSASNSMFFPRSPENTPSSAILPLTRMHYLIPPASEEDALIFDFSPEPEAIPHPSYISVSSSKSSIASRHITAAQRAHLEKNTPWTGPPELRPTTPPPGRPEVYPYSSCDTLATSSTGITSVGDSSVSSGPGHPPVPHNTSNIATPFPSLTAHPPSLPIDIPTPTAPSRRSSAATTVPPELQPHPPSMPGYLTLSHLSEAMSISLTSLSQLSGDWSATPQMSSPPPRGQTRRHTNPPSYTRAPGVGEQRLAAGLGVSPAPAAAAYSPAGGETVRRV